jgi:hypothetical protein
VATVTTTGAMGVAKGVGMGSAKITASIGAVNGSTNLTVGPAVLQSIAITPANPSIPLGLTVQLTATGMFTDLSTVDLTASATWQSGDVAVATFGSPAGKVTTKSVGTSAISATFGGVVGTTLFTVTAPALQGIQVTGGAISVNSTTQFHATGYYSDASSGDITLSVMWTSNDTTVVSIDQTGLAYGATPGVASISATRNGIKASLGVSVNP